MFGEVARATRSAYVPFLLAGFAGRRELFQDDGLHPVARAQPLILDNVWPRLKPLLRAVDGRNASPAPTQPRGTGTAVITK